MARPVSLLPEVPQALALALRQLGDRRILGVLGLALVIAAIVTGPFLLVFAAVFGLLEWILPDSLTLPWVGEVGFLGVFTDGLVSRTSWLFWTYLISPLAVAIVGALLDPIVEAVEARHYPDLPAMRRRPVVEIAGYALRFLGLMLAVSAAAWILAWITGIPAALSFVLASGYLIAREYFETVALRRLSPPEARRLGRAQLPALWLTGGLVALALNLPLINLIAPLVGVAAFTHLFHRTDHSPSG